MYVNISIVIYLCTYPDFVENFYEHYRISENSKDVLD